MAISDSALSARSRTTRTIVVHELQKQVPAVISLGALMLLGTAVNIVTPILFKVLLDNAIPAGDLAQVAWLLVAMVGLLLCLGWRYRPFKITSAST